jgi:SET domain-containing protein
MNNKRVLILKPSKIPNAGVGVFTILPIHNGELLIHQATKEEFIDIKQSEVDDNLLKYCIHLGQDNFKAPKDFLKMGILWYLNHNNNPNLAFINGRLHAIRNIKAQEELTIYYPDLESHPKNLIWNKEYLKDNQNTKSLAELFNKSIQK